MNEEMPVDLGLGSDGSVVGVPKAPESPVDLVPPVMVVPDGGLKSKRSLSGIFVVVPLVLGPMILAFSLAYSFNRANGASGSVNIQSKAANEATVKVTDSMSITPEIAAKWRNILNMVPKNPNTVVATASGSGKTATLVSGQPYSYPEVTFVWSGDRAVEPGTKITGYYVYFGPKNTQVPFPNDGDSVWPSKDGVLVTTNSYIVTNFVKGLPYYLFVQSVTDSMVPNQNLGMEEVAPYQVIQAKSLFTYNYQ